MRATITKFGLIAGGIMSGMFLLTLPFHDQIGFGPLGMAIGYASMVLAFLMVHVGMRTYRDTVAGGTVTFGEAAKVGALIALIAIAMYVVMWLIVSYTFIPNFMTDYATHMVDEARAAGKSAAEIEKMAAEMRDFAESYQNPFVRMAYTFLEPLPVAVPFTLGSAWLVSRRRRESSPTPVTAH